MFESSGGAVVARSSGGIALRVGPVIALIVGLDAVTPLGIATPMLYVVAVLQCLGAASARVPVVVAAIASGLTGVGWFLSPDNPTLHATALANRGFSLVAIWIACGLVVQTLGARADLDIARVRAVDLADRLHRERAALTETLKRLEDMKIALDQAAIVATTDTAGKIRYVNDQFCAISGFSREELLGQDHRIVNSGAHPKAFFIELWRALAAGRVWRGEICNRAKEGQLYWVDTTIVPFLDAGGRPYQHMAIRFDITQRKAAEARLHEQATLARLGEMASVVAHEVRNPLAGIAGALQIIGPRMPEGSEERMILGDILDRIGALNLTLSDVLQYARPRPPQWREVDLHGVLEGVLTAVATDPRFAHVELVVAEGSVIARADPQLLHAAVLNLALNAAQAVPQRGRVELAARTVGAGSVAILVRDDGPGIPVELRTRVFEPFVTTKARGTGLGLAIVKRVAEQHGGDVALESADGGGTVVRMTFPVAAGLVSG